MSVLHIASGNWELRVTIEDGVQVLAVYFCGTWYNVLLLVSDLTWLILHRRRAVIETSHEAVWNVDYIIHE